MALPASIAMLDLRSSLLDLGGEVRSAFATESLRQRLQPGAVSVNVDGRAQDYDATVKMKAAAAASAFTKDMRRIQRIVF